MLRIVLVDRDIGLKSAIFNQFQPLRSRNWGFYTRIIYVLFFIVSLWENDLKEQLLYDCTPESRFAIFPASILVGNCNKVAIRDK